MKYEARGYDVVDVERTRQVGKASSMCDAILFANELNRNRGVALLDEAIVEAVADGFHRREFIHEEVAKRIGFGVEMKSIDNRLRALKKAGRIMFIQLEGWCVP